MKKLITALLIFSCCHVRAQVADTIYKVNPAHTNSKIQKTSGFRYWVAPAALMSYGFIALNNHQLKNLNNSTKVEILEMYPQPVTKIDNFLQYTPAITVYGLNAVGIKGKNNLRDRTMIYGISTVLSTVFVYSLKTITKEERPDNSGNNSFPSGHTTTAFGNAEFLRVEYKDVSPWYGIAGYAAATATGILRMYNNKHWLSDVVAGAGVGILSTKLAYVMYPAIKRVLFKDKPVHAMVMPFYQNKTAGLAMVYHFGN